MNPKPIEKRLTGDPILLDKIQGSILDQVSRLLERNPEVQTLTELAHLLIDHISTASTDPQLITPLINQKQVILPPDEHGCIVRGTGEGTISRKYKSRTSHLIELLQQLNLAYECTAGVVEAGMIRQEPYTAFWIPTHKIVILVCNEIGNATFIVHNVSGDQVITIVSMTKTELPTRFPTKRITDPGNIDLWKLAIIKALSSPDIPNLRGPRKITTLPPSDDWQPITDLATTYNLDRGTICNWIAPHLTDHPEWLIACGDKRPVQFISPELVKMVTDRVNELNKLGQPPDDWLSAYEYARSRKIKSSTAQQLFNRVHQAHPSWGKEYLSRQKKLGFRVGWYYSPEAIAAADRLRANPRESSDILGKTKPPSDWVPIPTLVKESGRASNVLINWARQASTSLPSKVIDKFYNPETQRQSYYLSPKLAEMVRHRINTTPFIPNN